MGYPPVSGRLHTRYSPVRRSPAEYCYSPMPLDLHVLSLSLAFILSQDQTLHSIKTLKKLSLSLSHYSFIIFLNDRIALAVYLSPFNILKNSSFFSQLPPRFRSESGCKDNTNFSFPPNIFASFFQNFSEPSLQLLRYRLLVSAALCF